MNNQRQSYMTRRWGIRGSGGEPPPRPWPYHHNVSTPPNNHLMHAPRPANTTTYDRRPGAERLDLAPAPPKPPRSCSTNCAPPPVMPTTTITSKRHQTSAEEEAIEPSAARPPPWRSPHTRAASTPRPGGAPLPTCYRSHPSHRGCHTERGLPLSTGVSVATAQLHTSSRG
jgi:hypothetical protein